jgi:hypothetical protein
MGWLKLVAKVAVVIWSNREVIVKVAKEGKDLVEKIKGKDNKERAEAEKER